MSPPLVTVLLWLIGVPVAFVLLVPVYPRYLRWRIAARAVPVRRARESATHHRFRRRAEAQGPGSRPSTYT